MRFFSSISLIAQLGIYLGCPGSTTAGSNDIVINEIHYDPADKTKPAEFIELFNRGSVTVDLTNWQFSNGVDFTFPAIDIAPGGFVVIAQNPTTLLAEYGASALGPWSGKLSNSGEKITLRDSVGLVIDTVDYGVHFPWPTAANGDGASMELIHPSLDNNLAGSWRSYSTGDSVPEVMFLSAGDTAWRYRKGTSYPSNDTSGRQWFEHGYDETTDGLWLTGQTPIGYGDGDDATTLNDMRNSYQSIFLRHEFTIGVGQTIPSTLLLRAYYDDGCVVYINGQEVKRFSMPDGAIPFPPGNFSYDHESAWEESLLTAASAYLQQGTNTIAVQVLNGTIGSSDLSIDLELKTPAPGSISSGVPTPGAVNTAYSTITPPQIRQVDHFPEQPLSTDTVTITAKITDPDGVASVDLDYQIVDPGNYIRLSDVSYENSWATLTMFDDGTNGDILAGDSIFTVMIPASVQVHRRMIRYRIRATDTANHQIQVPYQDDPQPNFAYFCYDGVPSWQGTNQPGVSSVQTFSKGLLETIPVYHLIANSSDITNSQYSSSFRNTQFEGTLIYDGRVYDHVRFNIRGQFSTYVTGKNKWRLRFNRGHYFQARDNYGKKYESRWKDMKVNGGTAPWAHANRGMGGIDECVSYRLFELAGIPSSRTSYFHFRVVDDASEANPSDQYNGDFWGLYFSVEVPDGRFLDDRNLPDGNVYKLESPLLQDNQGADEPLGPSDGNTLRNNLNTSQSQQWWRDNVDHLSYARYKAVAEVMAHYDQRDGQQGYYYHNPDTDKWVFMPWDLDTVLTPTHKYYTWDRFRLCLTPSYPLNYLEGKNEQREMLDLLFNPKAVDTVLNEFIDIVNPPGDPLTWADADQHVWNYHTKSKHKGYYNRLTATANPGGATYTRTILSADHEGQMDFTRKFMSAGGHGYDNLLAEAADINIPNQPTISYTGATGFPITDLRFQSTAFTDPNGNGSFAAMEWRLGEVADPLALNYNPLKAPPHEIDAIWESGELTSFDSEVVIPPSVIATGSTYRARVRHQDTSGRWSHWSDPIEFNVSSPDLSTYRNSLVISEIMYKPTGGGDLEFIEIMNVGSATLDLSPVSFTAGIQFSFADSSITSIAPGEYVLVVKNKAAFEAEYGNSLPIAGETTSGLSNDGERITLSFGADDPIQDFVYNDVPPWPTSPDSTGASLVLIHPQSLPDHSNAINWRASIQSGGNPGTSDSTPYTGGNLVDYALSSGPTTESIDGIRRLTYSQKLGHDDVEVAPQWSTNLEDWSETELTVIQQTPDPNGNPVYTWSLPDSPRGFVRLRITER
ncbi:lamin tail domain-containing protein [Verrucomicrobiaceae bacterium N1E253]|uniref:Lamin tail domain-containing protein n=1 Tax=Oceaniferula marina TaxID=2748318 RepID=A0A851GJS6_9BACT|nr:lamin tail domain-containing protein [Oceaniferula marina]NWK54950.1 lamin tail domain-containing protein [Oceaniferula marina]